MEHGFNLSWGRKVWNGDFHKTVLVILAVLTCCLPHGHNPEFSPVEFEKDMNQLPYPENFNEQHDLYSRALVTLLSAMIVGTTWRTRDPDTGGWATLSCGVVSIFLCTLLIGGTYMAYATRVTNAPHTGVGLWLTTSFVFWAAVPSVREFAQP